MTNTQTPAARHARHAAPRSLSPSARFALQLFALLALLLVVGAGFTSQRASAATVTTSHSTSDRTSVTATGTCHSHTDSTRGVGVTDTITTRDCDFLKGGGSTGVTTTHTAPGVHTTHSETDTLRKSTKGVWTDTLVVKNCNANVCVSTTTHPVRAA